MYITYVYNYICSIYIHTHSFNTIPAMNQTLFSHDLAQGLSKAASVLYKKTSLSVFGAPAT